MVWNIIKKKVSTGIVALLWGDAPSNELEAFDRTWADKMLMLLLSAVTFSIKARESAPMAPIHVQTMTPPPRCFTDERVCFGSWAVPFGLHTLLLLSLWYKSILVSSIPQEVFPELCRLGTTLANCNLAIRFLQPTSFASCSVASLVLGIFFSMGRILWPLTVKDFRAPLQLLCSTVLFLLIDIPNSLLW